MATRATTLTFDPRACGRDLSARTGMVLAVAVSVALHLMIGVPLVAEMMRQASLGALAQLLGPPDEAAESMPDAEDRQDDPQGPLELLAGIDAGDPVRMTWIGYADYQKHLAQLSTVDQAAFTERVEGSDPEGDGSSGPEPPAPAPGEETPTAPAQPSPAVPVQAAEAAPPPPEAGGTAPSQPIDAPPTREADLENPPTLDAPRAPEATTGPTGSTSAEGAPGEKPPGNSGSGGGTAGGHTAERSDRESDARSIIEVPREAWVNGRPVAAQGVEIHTKKAQFPLLTRISTWPANPVCTIEFDRRGRPVRCRVIESSGYPRDIDEPVLDALYRWRATGRQLGELREGETLTLRVRILLR